MNTMTGKLEKVHDGTVLTCRPETNGSNVFLLTLGLDMGSDFEAKPGQFVSLLPSDETSPMPRPFTVVESVKGTTVTLLFGVVGKNTKKYSQLKYGDRVGIIGPQGKEIVFSPEKNKCIFVLGGNGGAAGVMPAKKAIREGKMVEVLLGAREVDQLAGVRYFIRLGVAIKTITEKQSGGGFVTDLLENALRHDGGKSEVVACGPRAMLDKVAEICMEHGNECQVIAEEMMACGMGSCKGCAIFGGENGEELKHVCSDGPAFKAEWIDRKKFMAGSPDRTRSGESDKKPSEIDFTCRLGPLVLLYPILNCSGTLDIEACEDGSMDISKLGAFVAKGLSLEERLGNPMPRVCETPSGMINAIGLEYIGLERFCKEALPSMLELGIPIIANINGKTADEFVELAFSLDDSGIAALEVNISCPNVKKGGMLFGKDPAMAASVVRAVRKATSLPLIVKLTPNVTSIGDVARAVEEAGADIISLVNTFEAMDIDVWSRRSKIANIFGGLSGPAIGPQALVKIFQVSQAVGLPIIGMGGNRNGKDAAKMMMAGASAVAFGTCGFANRRIYSQAVEQLAEIAKHNGFSATEQLVGSLIIPK